jgi:hypothetical protein
MMTAKWNTPGDLLNPGVDTAVDPIGADNFPNADGNATWSGQNIAPMINDLTN